MAVRLALLTACLALCALLAGWQLGERPPALTPGAQGEPSPEVAGARSLPRVLTQVIPALSAPASTTSSSRRIASTPVPAELAAELNAILEDDGERFGVVVEHLDRRERFEHNAARQLPSASVYKLAVAFETLRRVDLDMLSLDRRISIEERDAIEPEPWGGLDPGDEVTVRQALDAMMGVSSNSAAHAFMSIIGRESLNDRLLALGLKSTHVPLLKDGESDPDDSAMTSAADMHELLLSTTDSTSLSDASRKELYRLLALEDELDPVSPRLPDGTAVLIKTGNLEEASNVVGFINTPTGSITISIFDEGMDPGDARLVIGKIAQAVFDFYSAG